MMKYLLHVNKGVELRKRFEEIDTAVETNYDGGRIFKDIHILVKKSVVKAIVIQNVVLNDRFLGRKLEMKS